jgi:outer membrane protein TolC
MMRTAVLFLAGAVAASAQFPLPGQSKRSSPSDTEIGAVSPLSTIAPPSSFRGAVPQGKASSQSLDLSLSDAVRLGLERNLGTVLSSAGQRAARGERLIALSRLLPQVHAEVNESSRQLNLAAFGFKLSPDIPSLVGPFQLFDARAYVSQTLLNFRQMYEKRAAGRQLDAANFDAADARDGVVQIVTAIYWQSVAGASRIAAAEAQVATAESSYRLAEDRRSAGLVPAIDVLRAQVELQTERQRLIASRAAFEKAKLNLSQAIGIPGGQQLNLTDQLGFAVLPDLPDEAVIEQAYEQRSDYRSQAARLRAAELQRKGIRAVRLPSLSLDGDYGALGSSPSSSHGTYTVSVGLNIPIFAGGAERGAAIRADAEVERQQAQLDELRSRIGFEVRSALLDLNSAKEQVAVSSSALDLAKQQVTQASDRFEAGVTDTLEVVQAQQGLAAANESYIAGLFAYNLAKVQLARALGGTERNLAQWAAQGSQP